MSDILEDIDICQLDNAGSIMVDTPSTLNILEMNNDCTRLVFDRLTLNQLIHLRAVCHTWNDIITDICEHKRSLQLTFSKHFTKYYIQPTGLLNLHNESQFQICKQNLLSISQKLKGASSGRQLKRNHDGSFSEQQNAFNQGICFVARLFPNITNFFCDFKYDRMLELNYILWKWSTNLNTLAIFSCNDNDTRICKDALQEFVNCLGLMRSLRRLHLNGNNRKLELPNVPIFGQLEEFMFSNYHVDFAPYIAQLDANRCKILRVGCHSGGWNTSLNFSETNPELASKLTHLVIRILLPNHISLHYAEFRNITHLEIVDILDYSISMAVVLQQIVPLQKLEILALNLCDLSSDIMERHSNLNPNYRHTFPIFHNTITELRLLDNDNCNSSKSHIPQFREYHLLAKIFPKVRKIGIYTTSSNKLNNTTFDAQYRPRFSEAFGERVEVTFFPSKILSMEDFY